MSDATIYDLTLDELRTAYLELAAEHSNMSRALLAQTDDRHSLEIELAECRYRLEQLRGPDRVPEVGA